MKIKMERKQEESWVQNSNISINDDDKHHPHHDHDEECLCDLKREISCHSLYSLLIQSHINCLKLCLGKMENIEIEINNETAIPNQQANLFVADQPELDQFMEAYCVSLQKLKEEMEEPQQESMAFINFMYSELDHLLIDIPEAENAKVRKEK